MEKSRSNETVPPSIINSGTNEKKMIDPITTAHTTTSIIGPTNQDNYSKQFDLNFDKNQQSQKSDNTLITPKHDLKIEQDSSKIKYEKDVNDNEVHKNKNQSKINNHLIKTHDPNDEDHDQGDCNDDDDDDDDEDDDDDDDDEEDEEGGKGIIEAIERFEPQTIHVSAPDRAPTHLAIFTHCQYLYIGVGRWQIYVQMWFVEDRLKREVSSNFIYR